MCLCVSARVDMPLCFECMNNIDYYIAHTPEIQINALNNGNNNYASQYVKKKDTCVRACVRERIRVCIVKY